MRAVSKISHSVSKKEAVTTDYNALAQEMVATLEATNHRPPHDELSQAIRGEMAVLRLLDKEKRQLLAGEISRRLNMSTSRIAAVLNSLEKKGMIVRCTDPGDRRRVSVALTESGKAFCRERREEALCKFSRLLERLGKEDARQFVDLLKRVFVILDEEVCPCGRQGGMK